MSIKTQQDKTRTVGLHVLPNPRIVGMYDGVVGVYPWTARQKRQAKSRRKTRKQTRTGRIAAIFAKKTGK